MMFENSELANGRIASPGKSEPVQPTDDGGRVGRFEQLVRWMPIALWEVSNATAWLAFDSLKAQGIGNVAAHLAANPDVLENACDGLLVSRVNHAAVRLFGGNDERCLLRPVRYLFSATPNAAAHVFAAYLEGKRIHLEEMCIETFDRRILDVLLLVMFPYPPENLDTTVFMMVEVTDRRLAETNLKKLQAEFAHTARISVLGELATSIAHEVKQPLSAIIMNGDVALNFLSQKEPRIAKVAQLVERIIDGAAHATDVVSRIQSMASKQSPVWADFSLNAVIEDALRFVMHESLAKGVTIRTNLARDMPLISGDRIQLQQVVVNLLVNAIQSFDEIPAGGPRDVEVSSLATPDGATEFIVADTGFGIGEQHLHDIFSPFFTTKASGMGMGLAISQTIVRMHDGEITAGERPGGGAWFKCHLPTSRLDN